MTVTKYGKYIIKGSEQGESAYPRDVPRGVVRLDGKIMKGAFYACCIWYFKTQGKGSSPPAHIHDFDEVLAFIGSNPEDQSDLGGEIEFWLGDEKHVLTESCFIFVPKGLKHSPFVIKKVYRPIFHFGCAPECPENP